MCLLYNGYQRTMVFAKNEMQYFLTSLNYDNQTCYQGRLVRRFNIHKLVSKNQQTGKVQAL